MYLHSDLKINMVPKVAMNAGIFNLPTMIPLMKPMIVATATMTRIDTKVARPCPATS